VQNFGILHQQQEATMATPVAPSLGGNGNNQDNSAYTQPVRELIDIANMPISVAAEGPTTPLATQRNPAESTNEPSAPTAATTTKAKAKRTRAKVPMSNKHLLASKELFVDPKFVLRCTGPDELLVEGKIVKCPNEKTNGSCFKVDWLVNLPNTVDPGCLRHWHHKDSFTKPLRDAITLYEEKNGGQPSKAKKAKGVAVVSRGGKSHPTTPPETQQWRARNNMRTAASASFSVSSVGGSMTGSTISSLSHSRSYASGRSSDEDISGRMLPPPPRRTRHATITDPVQTVESDSDEGDSVDENDNAYTFQHDRDADDLGGNESSSEDEAAALPVIEQPQGPQKRMWERLKELQWDFQPVSANDPTVSDLDYYPFTCEPSLKEGVGHSVTDPFEAFCRVGGMSYEFVARIAANSNDCYHAQIKPELGQNKFHNLPWKDVTTEEMFRFFGILLKISLSPVDGGGYPAHFRPKNKELNTGFGAKKKTLIILNSIGFAQKIMPLSRFKQIRAAFHPEHKRVSNSGDKCQLSIEGSNKSVERCFLFFI